MRFILPALLVFALISQSALALKFKDGYPDQYVVVKGDTLWDIAARFLDSPWAWREIWQANPDIENPHLIYPGDILQFEYVDGKPRISKVGKRGYQVRHVDSKTVKLSPRARISDIETSIPTIPLDAISSFLTGSRIVSPTELDATPYVLMGAEHRLVTGAGDTMYAKGQAPSTGTVSIFRAGDIYTDPDTKEILGMEAREIGLARISAVDNDVLTLSIQRSSEEVRRGDRLLPTDDRIITTSYQPSVASRPVEGKMIAVLNGVSNIGQYDVVVINKGSRDGLEDGNVLSVYRAGEVVRDPKTREPVKLPSEKAGILMVFRTFDKLSYGLILKALRPLSINDEVRNPKY